MTDLIKIFDTITQWVYSGSRNAGTNSANKLVRKYREDMKKGLDANGNNLRPLAKVTLQAPINRDRNSVIRGSLGNTPLYATGKTAESIIAERVGNDKWVISSQTDLGNDILSSNARGGGNGKPFYGDPRKPVRDPLTVGEQQMDLVENEISKSLEHAISYL